MIEKEKKYFAGWWLWVLLLIVITSVVGFGLRFTGVVGERIIFENSYQKDAADNAKRDMLEAELVGINARLRSGVLNETQRADLEANKAAVQFQLNKGN